MRKLIVAAVAGIVLLGGIAVAVIVLATGRNGLVTGPVGIEPAAPVPDTAPPPLPVPPSLPAFPGAAQQPAPPPLIMSPPRPKPPEGSWGAVALVSRFAAAGPVGAAVGRELNELKPRLDVCFDEEVQARYGQKGVTAMTGYAPRKDYGRTILMLEIEAGSGQVRIVDAPVETRSGASDGLIACAQGVLRGHVFRAAAAKEPSRHRIRFPLFQ